MPSEGSKGLGNFWFSFDFESVHFASISTENVTTPGTDMYEWLVADLAAAAARPTPPVWTVLLCHRPLYSSDVSEYATHAPGSPFLTDLEPVLQKFRVQLVLTGHMHMYERSFPVVNGTVVNATANANAGSGADSSFYTIQPSQVGEQQPELMCATGLQPDRSAPLHVFAEPNAPTYIVQGTAGAMQFERSAPTRARRQHTTTAAPQQRAAARRVCATPDSLSVFLTSVLCVCVFFFPLQPRDSSARLERVPSGRHIRLRHSAAVHVRQRLQLPPVPIPRRRQSHRRRSVRAAEAAVNETSRRMRSHRRAGVRL